MASRAMIDEFMARKKLALVRASRKTPVRGVSISEELSAKGYCISVVYLDEGTPGSRLQDIKEPVDGVILSVPSDQTERAVLQAIEAKIPRIWMQKGTESAAALRLCGENKIQAVHGECVMMFAEPVTSFHAFHRWIRKSLGKLPK